MHSMRNENFMIGWQNHINKKYLDYLEELETLLAAAKQDLQKNVQDRQEDVEKIRNLETSLANSEAQLKVSQEEIIHLKEKITQLEVENAEYERLLNKDVVVLDYKDVGDDGIEPHDLVSAKDCPKPKLEEQGTLEKITKKMTGWDFWNNQTNANSASSTHQNNSVQHKKEIKNVIPENFGFKR
jgi:hypothetical protein